MLVKINVREANKTQLMTVEDSLDFYYTILQIIIPGSPSHDVPPVVPVSQIPVPDRQVDGRMLARESRRQTLCAEDQKEPDESKFQAR